MIESVGGPSWVSKPREVWIENEGPMPSFPRSQLSDLFSNGNDGGCLNFISFCRKCLYQKRTIEIFSN